MRKFWNFVSNQEGISELRINGYISDVSWFEDDVTPKEFENELKQCKGDLTVWLNSGGGDCFAASSIYTMLMEYKKNGKVTIKIDGIAASAASVIAMSGDDVLMSPTSNLMIHNPASIIFGEVSDLESGIEMLTEVKESIINAYVLKTKLSRAKISKLMDAETWFNAHKAIELGFADGIMYANDEAAASDDTAPFMWNANTAVLATVNAMRFKLPKKQQKNDGTPFEILEKRLSLLK